GGDGAAAGGAAQRRRRGRRHAERDRPRPGGDRGLSRHQAERAAMSLLAVENLSVAYGDLYAVREVSFALDEHAVFVLLGANGAGKTSILRAISGLVRSRGGSVTALGASLLGLSPHQVARAGIAHVPEGRRIFAHLTVEENLTVS